MSTNSTKRKGSSGDARQNTSSSSTSPNQQKKRSTKQTESRGSKRTADSKIKQDDDPIQTLFNGSQPTPEEITREIEKLEELVKRSEERLHQLDNEPSPIADGDVEMTDCVHFAPKTKVQELYYCNMISGMNAETKLDFLLYKDDDKLEKKPRNPTDYECYEVNERAYTELIPELTTIIQERLHNIERKAREEGAKYKRLRYEWWKKNKITLDDVRNENIRFQDQLAKIPPMLNEEERRNAFVSRNGFMTSEQVLREYQEKRALEVTWTEEEKKIFAEKFTKHPKEMRTIAGLLPNRTTGDVVTFYYNYKLTEDFKKMKHELKLNNKYRKRFVDEGKRKDTKDREPVSPMTPSEPIFVTETQVVETKSTTSSRSKKKEEEESANEWSQVEINKFKNLITKVGSNFEKIAQKLKTKDEEQCRQFFEENKAKYKFVLPAPKEKKKKVASTTSTPTASPTVRKPTKESMVAEKRDTTPLLPPSPAAITKPNKTKKILKVVSIWTVSERDAFLEYFREYGRDWKKLAELIPTKTETQIRSLFLNYKIKLGLTLPTKRRKKKRRPIPYVETNPEVATPDLFTLSVLACDVQEKGSPFDDIEQSPLTSTKPPRSLSSSLQVSNNSQLRRTSKKSQKNSVSTPSPTTSSSGGYMDVLATISCQQQQQHDSNATGQYIPSLQDLLQSHQSSSSSQGSTPSSIHHGVHPNNAPSPPYMPYQQEEHSQFPRSHPLGHSLDHTQATIPSYMKATPTPSNSFQPASSSDGDHHSGMIMRTLSNQAGFSTNAHHHVVNDINLTSNEVLTPFQVRTHHGPPPLDNSNSDMSRYPYSQSEPKKANTSEIVLEEGGFGDFPNTGGSYESGHHGLHPPNLTPNFAAMSQHNRTILNNTSLPSSDIHHLSQPHHHFMMHNPASHHQQ
ncbi:hypothetical protein C9374_001624 [Naegleria lovaniensis]|uniref:Uncharacterized protein n=1 Tax=Naegleria lovaniensis TaxID=51637 RepID=A0AA88GR15_NAELO|nr:uncharacterized protein C9374_001624 [Naegleria lovaniensis]KAG2387292.1 hypothetical protein C9374_001624 [Naegleria lovaniensis]